MKWLAALFVFLGTTPTLAPVPLPDVAQQDSSPVTSASQKIDDLMRLFKDPEIRRWIEVQAGQKTGTVASAETSSPETTSMGDVIREMATWEGRARDRFQTVISAVPDISSEIERVFLRLRADATGNGHTTASIFLSLLVALGIMAEWFFRRRWQQHGKGIEHYLPTVVFAAFMAVSLFAIQSPPLVRLVATFCLLAFVAYRLVATAIGHAAHPEVHGRLKIIVGLGLAMTVSTATGTILDVDANALQAAAFLISCIMLGLSVELVWHSVNRSVATRSLLCLHLAAVWLLWCLDLRTAFWIGLYILLLPPMMRAIGHAIRDYVAVHFLMPASDSRSVLLVRGARAAITGLAIAWIATVWDMDGHMIGHGDPQTATLFYGFLKSIVILLLADLVWHLTKAAIDRNIMTAPAGSEAENPTEETHATRLHTLLPILRNVLAVSLFIVAGLVILGQLGVDIGPLIAGAGIFGVAIGFGSQALVRDVISGIFYLFDDAFRVGEYIQAKNYKGTVEGFSLRSVKLRHHRGPLFTVPFGELGAVENMSRDWSKIKFSVTVPYDTDIEKARKIGKAIGQELLGDPELGRLFIQPLKMKGVEEFGEYGIAISFAMVTVPTSQQSFIRRSAYAMLREAFQKNGIAFAQPSIQVGGGKTPEATAAAYQSQLLARAGERKDSTSL
ncbi:Moderate conductance mechanosensitive channel YbiO [Agrobacterium fabrum]|uniref:mechanosensitive ion channel family protein n=1 Tax=Agrobacterium fabrum TaxID=1176649 RepID=UPI001D2CB776|nr:mechanosensitive ion channel family protein [Agrobacterium fabrum]CAH0250277.1 Moderate conductance mechanosensitive channel YbiO [Agrobacterium fabrum]CAH0250429.1 Moderate conductance mechanosensitive channel YbiO [Agrobacterium fabrum]